MRPGVRLVLSPEVIQRAASSGAPQPLFGIFRPDESLIQVLSGHAGPRPLFRRVGCVNPAACVLGPRIRVAVEGTEVPLELEKDLPVPSSVQLLSKWGDLDDRRRGLLPEGGLSQREVHLIGAGSLGSVIALLLAQAGVGRQRIYDRDRLDTPNLARHVCGLSDHGREKAPATAEHVAMFGCDAIGVTADFDELDDRQLDLLLKNADVVVATTDSPAVQFIVNEAIVRLGRVGVFAGAYELARAGEVLVVRPGNGPCLYCSTGFRASAAPAAAPHQRKQAYQNADLNRLTAEPGLGVDITYLASVAAAHVLAALDPTGIRGTLLERGGFTLVHGPSSPRAEHADLFRCPMGVVHARVVRDEPCEVCRFCSTKELQP
jgi:molybdopterin/thiamine biosynthesis adenylyltransferase